MPRRMSGPRGRACGCAACDTPAPAGCAYHVGSTDSEHGMPATHPSPSTVATSNGGAGTPIRNMRVTFWGVQGSCPIFPTGREVNEYARRIATYTIERAVTDLAEKAARG